MNQSDEIENESIITDTDFDPETQRQEILRELDKEYAKEYYKKNKDYWKTIINCDCGARVDYSHLSRHCKTKKHILNRCPILELETESKPEPDLDPETVDQEYVTKLSEYQTQIREVESKILEMKQMLADLEYQQKYKVFQKWLNTRISRLFPDEGIK